MGLPPLSACACGWWAVCVCSNHSGPLRVHLRAVSTAFFGQPGDCSLFKQQQAAATGRQPGTASRGSLERPLGGFVANHFLTIASTGINTQRTAPMLEQLLLVRVDDVVVSVRAPTALRGQRADIITQTGR